MNPLQMPQAPELSCTLHRNTGFHFWVQLWSQKMKNVLFWESSIWILSREYLSRGQGVPTKQAEKKDDKYWERRRWFTNIWMDTCFFHQWWLHLLIRILLQWQLCEISLRRKNNLAAKKSRDARRVSLLCKTELSLDETEGPLQIFHKKTLIGAKNCFLWQCFLGERKSTAAACSLPWKRQPCSKVVFHLVMIFMCYKRYQISSFAPKSIRYHHLPQNVSDITLFASTIIRYHHLPQK